MAGFADSLVPNWVNSGIRGSSTHTRSDQAKADALMKDAGYAREATDLGKDGKKLEFEFYFRATSRTGAAATYATDPLNKWGLKLVAREPFDRPSYPTRTREVMITKNAWASETRTRAVAVRPFREYNKDRAGGGMKYPLTQTYSGGSITSTPSSMTRSPGSTRRSRKTRLPRSSRVQTSCSHASDLRAARQQPGQ